LTYEYDAENNRVSVTENSGGSLSETEYVVNPHAALSQVLIKTVGNEQTYYVYGLGLIGQEVAGEYSTYHFDLRGSTVAITDVSGKVTDRYQYSAYGELLGSTGDTDTPFLFNGRDGVVTDTNGLYYMRARYYNPEIRRFVSQDTLLGVVIDGQSLNRYAYVQGDPVGFVDPLGLARDGWGKKLETGNSYLSVSDFRLLQMGKYNLVQARSLPAKGKPNSTDQLYNPDGTLKQERWYGPDGRAERDRDYNHSGEDTHEFPHDHEWDWSKAPPRKKGVPVPPTLSPNKIQDSTSRVENSGSVGGWAAAGAVLYWVISAGSRVAFPIRNFIPVI